MELMASSGFMAQLDRYFRNSYRAKLMRDANTLGEEIASLDKEMYLDLLRHMGEDIAQINQAYAGTNQGYSYRKFDIPETPIGKRSGDNKSK